VGRALKMSTSADAVPVEQLSRPHVARALAFMDRDRSSPTYGAMDRAFWYYRTLTDFPGATWQQAMVGFAAILAAEPHDSPDAAAMRAAANAALSAWTRCQHRSGAFDEWYRNEHSYCPTAITTAGALVTLHLLGGQAEPTVRAQVLRSAARAADWLAARYNAEVMNQNLAAAVAFAGLAQLGGSARWRNQAETLLRRIERDQSSEGWFPEYGGFDFGYSTLALDFLALAADLGLASIVDGMAERLIRFLLEVTEAGKPVPGRLGSRGTAHVFPFGALSFAARIPAAGPLAKRLLGMHAAGLARGPAEVDDRYFAYFYFPAFSLAYLAARRSAALPRPETDPAPANSATYPQSGLVVRRLPGATLFCSYRLGGAVAFVTEQLRAPLYHLGYTVTVAGRRYSSACWRDRSPAGAEPQRLCVAAPFSAVSGGQPLRRWSIAFHIVAHLLVTSALAELVQSAIKRLMIAPKQTTALTLERQIDISGDSAIVADTLRPSGPLPVEDIAVTSEITMHSPSARQDPGIGCVMDRAAQADAIACLRSGKPVTIRWAPAAAIGGGGGANHTIGVVR
jgi:hypothetical protein